MPKVFSAVFVNAELYPGGAALPVNRSTGARQEATFFRTIFLRPDSEFRVVGGVPR
jgi:hypothetical protein